MIRRFEDIVLHPVTIVGAALTSLGHLFSIPFIDALLAVLWSNLPTLFTATSIGAFTIVPNVDGLAIAGDALQVAAIVLGVAYAGKLLYGVYTDAQRRL